jgi:hypothetical protein
MISHFEDYLFMFTGISAMAGVPMNLALVLRLRERHWQVFNELGRPSIFYFAGVQWMYNFKYFRWLWTCRHKSLSDRTLTTELYWLRGFWIIFHVGFLLWPIIVSVEQSGS